MSNNDEYSLQNNLKCPQFCLTIASIVKIEREMETVANVIQQFIKKKKKKKRKEKNSFNNAHFLRLFLNQTTNF